MSVISYILIVLVAYLLGSIPTGFLVAKARGIDIRTVGSGNIGATNALRVLGKRVGAFVLIADGLKGYAACAWTCNLLLPLLKVASADLELHRLIAGIAAVLGHNYTCWLKFKGGKGVATTAGVYVALAPLALGIAFGTWVLVFVVTRFVSLASMAAAAGLAVAVWLTTDSLLLGVVTTALATLSIAKHKANIQRLLAGTESRISFKSNKGTAP